MDVEIISQSAVNKGKRRVHALSVEQSDFEDEIVNSVTLIHSAYREDIPTKRLLFVEMRIGRDLVKLQLDCGASVNLISARHVPDAEMTPSTNILQMWNKSLKKLDWVNAESGW